MRRRIHTVLTEAWHFVALVATTGLVVSGIAAAVGFAIGKRGGHEVVLVVIVVAVTGAVSVLIGVFRDPMSGETSLVGSPATFRAVAEQAGLLHEEESGLSPELEKLFREDDVLYAGGVLLIGLAVLLGFACKWAGVPPASPFG